MSMPIITKSIHSEPVIISKVFNSPIDSGAQWTVGKQPRATRWSAREKSRYKSSVLQSQAFTQQLMKAVAEKLKAVCRP